MATTSSPLDDQLAALFAASLSISMAPSAPSTQFFSSAHYTPSTHHLPPTSNAIESTLLAHSINPSYLFPAQLAFYSTSPLDVRLRLLDLWRTAPLRAGDRDAIRYRYGELLSTSLLQEEVMARLRQERDLAERNVVASAEPYMASGYEGQREDERLRDMEAGYGRWVQERELEMGM